MKIRKPRGLLDRLRGKKDEPPEDDFIRYRLGLDSLCSDLDLCAERIRGSGRAPQVVSRPLADMQKARIREGQKKVAKLKAKNEYLQLVVDELTREVEQLRRENAILKRGITESGDLFLISA